MTLLERVSAALSADYDVRDEIGRGGMGAVYLAVDRALDRPVAIKVLLPEQAVARAVERFLREARALAAVEHPNVLRVHRAGEAGGLFYYVMEHIPGETLAECLRRGPLSPSELDGLAADLLDALETIHDAGIVHRDVKPSNIFFVDGRALLGDFGVALPSGSGTDRLTVAGEVVGTPRYMAPEQRSGDATEETDLYAAAMVLYEATTATAWQDAAGAAAPWAGVPGRLRAPLQRALDPDPGRRWHRAADLREALVGGASRRRLRPKVAMAIAVVLVVAAVPLVVLTQGEESGSAPAVGDLAVLPFEVIGSETDSVGRDLAVLTTYALDGLPDLKVIPAGRTSVLEPAGAGSVPPEVWQTLGAVYVAHGLIRRRGDRLELSLVVESAGGERLPERIVAGVATDPAGMANSIALALLQDVQPLLVSAYRSLEERSTDSIVALREFVHGEHAFHRNQWTAAEEHYWRALEIDPDFALAEWRLWNVWRWRLTGREVVDLERLYREHGEDLGAADRVLLEAMATEPGPRRIEALERATGQHGYSDIAWWLLGDEVLHRGPLTPHTPVSGTPLFRAGRLFQEAAARNPRFAPAYEHGAWAWIRVGRKEEARRALDSLAATAGERAPGETLTYPTMLEHAYRERFEPERAAAARDTLFEATDPSRWESLAFFVRMGLAMDVPEAQIDLGRRLVDAPGAPASLRTTGHVARALALVVTGRPGAALQHFDSAATLAATTGEVGRSTLEAAEWRVVLPAAAGVPMPPEETARGRTRLREEVGRASALAPRAAWALALDAWAAGDGAAAEQWQRAIATGEEDPERSRLLRLARAFAAVNRGDPEDALRLSEPLLDDQFLPRQRDPFARTVLHLARARAYEALGDRSGARRERMWADNSDIAHVLIGADVQAVEVDWAVSPYSDHRRAQLALEEGDRAEGCHLLERVLWLWQDVERALEADRAEVARLHSERCP